MTLRTCVALTAALVATGCGPEVVKVTMKQLSGSGQTGTATLTAVDADTTRVELDIAPSANPAVQAAHIHDGDCPGLDTIIWPLSDVSAGKSSTEVPASLSTIRLEQRAINVHAADGSGYVSCGEIPL